MENKIALITGVTGQDGSFLAELLIEKGYEVHGIFRHSSVAVRHRISHLEDVPHFHLHFADMCDPIALARVISQVKPTEIYNLASYSDYENSFQNPISVMETDGIGIMRILQSLGIFGLQKSCRVFNACSSEIYDKSSVTKANNDILINPSSPLAASKLYSYEIVRDFRNSKGLYCCSGVLFPHESERNNSTSLFQSIIKSALAISRGNQNVIQVENLDDAYDWGYAKDYVECMWMMLQREKPEDCIIATKTMHTIRELCTIAFKKLGIDLIFKGMGSDEKGRDANTGDVLVEVKRDSERSHYSDNHKEQETLPGVLVGWNANTGFGQIVDIVINELKNIE